MGGRDLEKLSQETHSNGEYPFLDVTLLEWVIAQRWFITSLEIRLVHLFTNDSPTSTPLPLLSSCLREVGSSLEALSLQTDIEDRRAYFTLFTALMERSSAIQLFT